MMEPIVAGFRSKLLAIIVTCSAVASLTTALAGVVSAKERPVSEKKRPNIILVMADDQGWGQVGYNGHPLLKTPHLDAMASNGIRFNRFYAAGPVCSPTRASVLTGRTHVRTGVPSHGHNLCLQEKTLSQALKDHGYQTGHFGKWHLNGLRGPGVPILKTDANHPGKYGFTEWVSVTNFFDLDPLMSRQGKFEQFYGDSSDITVLEALKFIEEQATAEKPFLAVIWYGSPHNPQRALKEDRREFNNTKVADHLGEIVGIDRSVGRLRKGLRDLEIEKNTLVWYCSDNGGLNLDPDSVGGLRGHKGSLWEGGIRVPGIIEWPGRIAPATTDFPASTMDIFPTLIDLLGLPRESHMEILDGESIQPLFDGETPSRTHGIPFRYKDQAAMIDGNFKLLSGPNRDSGDWALYDLKSDPDESSDLSQKMPGLLARMITEAEAMVRSVEASRAGKDYPEGEVVQPPRNAFWRDIPEYKPYLEKFTEATKAPRPAEKSKSPKRSSDSLPR